MAKISASVDKQVGDYTYTFFLLPVGKGRKAYLRLMKLLSGALKNLEGQSSLTQDTATQALIQLVQDFSEEDFEYFCNLLEDRCSVTGGSFEDRKPLLSDCSEEHFQGAYDELIAWLVAGLQVQFASSFLGLLKKAKEALGQVKAPKSDSPSP